MVREWAWFITISCQRCLCARAYRHQAGHGASPLLADGKVEIPVVNATEGIAGTDTVRSTFESGRSTRYRHVQGRPRLEVGSARFSDPEQVTMNGSN